MNMAVMKEKDVGLLKKVLLLRVRVEFRSRMEFCWCVLERVGDVHQGDGNDKGSAVEVGGKEVRVKKPCKVECERCLRI